MTESGVDMGFGISAGDVLASANKYAFSDGRKVSTVERIVENLITLIKERSLVVGDKLPSERQLCQLVGVSRPVLREALKALQVMNIIDIRQGAGAYLRNLDPQDVVEHLDIVFHLDSSLYRDLYEARRILEAGIARMACSRAQEADIAAIEENIRRAESCVDDAQAFYKTDVELHELIMNIAGNRIMPVFMQSINKLALLTRQTSNAIASIRVHTIQEHKAILAAMKSKDTEAAARAMAAHISSVENRFFEIKETAGGIK
jgi:GntR family transcriptional repressor for pyruvate dehydrogenase complex